MLLMVSSFVTFSQDYYGYVYDRETDTPLEGVLIQFTTPPNQSARTNSEGRFRVSKLNFDMDGALDMRISKCGYDPINIERQKPTGTLIGGTHRLIPNNDYGVRFRVSNSEGKPVTAEISSNWWGSRTSRDVNGFEFYRLPCDSIDKEITFTIRNHEYQIVDTTIIYSRNIEYLNITLEPY